MFLGIGIGVGRSRQRTGAIGPSYEAETNALLARIAAVGLSPSGTIKGHINSLIGGFIDDDVWSDLDGFYLPGAHEGAALFNWRQDAFNLTKSGTITFSQANGAASDGVAGSYLTTGFVPSLAGGLFQKDSAHIAAWWKSAGQDVNYAAGQSTVQCRVRDTSNRLSFRINDGTTTNSATNSVADASGLTIFQREGAAIKRAYRLGSATPLVDVTTTSTSLASGEMLFFTNSPANTPTADRLFFGSLGRALSTAKQAAMKTHVEAYLTAMGASL
jgi:hypothetical protein